ncbi:putative autophagy-related protein 11 [Bombus huntii]|uniref:putative autophagy-related protein 11 n=1 Tax=Bombus huntii TaxID=85661 RepID=UPI0021AA02F9|nr:putative autophagy-related protein 11 [Bombus huntii]
MNPFDSTIESIPEISKIFDEDCNCTAIDKTIGEFCGETETLRIINEFQKLYETRIENVDREFENEFDQVCMKLEISKEWIKNLKEQNVMLVQVVEDLEQAACNRVKLLEQKLKHSSVLVSGNMSKSMNTEMTIHTLSNRVSILEKDEKYMQQKIEFLQSDIRGLLELIRRAVQENHWNLDDIKFFEIQPSDIPVPTNCTCDQGDISHKKMQSLKLQIKHLQENEKRMIVYQKELEDKLIDLNAKLQTKEDTVKACVSQFQNLSDNLRKHVKFTEQIACSSFIVNDQEPVDIFKTFVAIQIMLVAGIVEKLFIEKDLETKNLQERLRDAESNLIIVTRNSDISLNNLKIQLNEKYKTIQEIEQQMVNLQKVCAICSNVYFIESIEKQIVLTAEVTERNEVVTSLQKQVAMLQEQCRSTNMQIHFKEGIIKEMRRKLRQAKFLYSNFFPYTCNRYDKVTIDNQEMESFYKLCEKIMIPKMMYTSAEHNNDSFLQTYINNILNHNKLTKDDVKRSRNPTNQQNQILLYLSKVKSFMEQEKEDLFNLKIELEKTVENLCSRKDKEYETIDSENNVDNIRYKLAKNIEYVDKIHLKKEESIEIINSLLQMENNHLFHVEDLNCLPSTDINRRKLMDIFRACIVEAQLTMEDMKDEINIIVSSFKCRHQKYVDLNKEVMNVQNQLIKSRGIIAEVINELQLQGEERIRHNDRITSRKNKLKDIKNEINLSQSQLSIYINEMQTNENISSYAENVSNYDLLCSVIEEIEQTSSSLQIFQVQGCCIVKEFEKMKNQFCEVDSSTRKLQEKIDEALTEHDIVELTLSQKEQKLQKLEEEVDVIHLKVKNVLESFFFPKEHVSDYNIMEAQLYTQILNEILQTKQAVYKLRKEYDELKYKLSQSSLHPECDKKTCSWKCRVTDLQDQVKILQHEAKCNEEANNFLRNNIQSIEEELHITQTKADNYRRSHSIDNMKLKKKIIELENTLKFQKEIECTLQRQLNDSEIELKRSKELLNSSHNEHSMEETLLRYGCYQFRYDTMTAPQLFKKLQNTIKSTKTGLQELKAEFKKLICEDSSNSCSSAKTLMNLLEKLQKYENELDNCTQEIEELKNTLYSKDKLIENMDEIIKIQKDSIVMTQAELKELHKKFQEKIDNQDQIISQYEKEKKELLEQNELQVQTIGHLQNAVVEAKKCIDQMGHRTVSDMNEQWPTISSAVYSQRNVHDVENNRTVCNLQFEEKIEAIRLLTVYAEETQSQYNECFAEAAKQDKLLELQRDAIHNLQQKISSMEYDNNTAITFIHITYYSILKTIQEQLETRVNEIEALKNERDTLIQSKCYLESKYLNTKMLWQEAEGKLLELRKETLKIEHKTKITEDKGCQYKIEVKDKNCTTQDIFDWSDLTYNNTEQCKNLSHEHDLQSEIGILIGENEDMKRQLQKYKLDFDIIDKELKTEKESGTYVQQISFELQKLRDTECCLQYENEQLKCDLKKQTIEIEDLLEKLQLSQENNTKFEKLLKKLEDRQIQINDLCSQIVNNEIVIKKQTEIIEELEKKLDIKNKQINAYLSELNEAEEEMSTLHERIQSLKTMLKEKSDDMAKLQADYEVMKNENSILKMENSNFEDKTKEDICQLKAILKDLQMQLCFTEDNYCRVTKDFNRTQEQLIKITKREADLQECLTNMEMDYCLKLSTIEKEKTILGDCLDKLKDELEEIQRNYSSKNSEHCKLQDICKSYAEQLHILQQQIEGEKEKIKQMEESNHCIVQQLQEYKEQNCNLIKEKSIIEQNNCEIISELQETHKSLLDLKKECQLKNKSLACISAELTETAMSRSELCNQSQYVVSCIRVWMEEQREYVNKLSTKLKSQQQELVQLEFEKRVLVDETRRLKHMNHALIQRLKRIHRHGGRNVRNVCAGCQILPKNIDIHLPTSSKSQKKLNLTRTAQRMSVCSNGSWFPKMKYLVNELRKNNVECSENCFNRMNTDLGAEENHDCGYQSSTSK